MKKLLITSMAAVAIGLYAKADFTGNNESFEGYPNEGPLFTVNETGKYTYGEDWTSEATPEDGIFTVTNISNITTEEAPYPTDRPLTGENLKALAIDTEKSLIRKAISGSDDELEGASLEGEGGAPIFFDSVVQFTATDAKPTPGNDDKLMVWLYASDDVDNDNPGVFGETTPTTSLIITASYYELGNYVVTNYLTGVEIAPDSWHRLTIKSFKDSGHLKFNVWVDKTPVTGGTESDFISLQYASENVDTTLKGVAFEGKGVVDDLVFTTDAPTFAGGGGEELTTYAIKAQYVQEDVNVSFYYDEEGDNGVDPTSIDIEHSTVYIYIQMKSGATLTGVTVNGTPVTNLPNMEDNAYNIQLSFDNPTPGTEYNVVINTTNSGSGGDPEVTEKPTVGDNTYDNGADLTTDVKSDMTITVPEGWYVDGKELKNANKEVFATFAPYYILTQDGLTVAVTLDQKAAAPFAEATDLAPGEEVLELDETIGEGESAAPAVGVRIKAFKGLYYGLGTASQLGNWTKPAEWQSTNNDGTVIKLTAPKQGVSGFYRIEVKDINPNPAQ